MLTDAQINHFKTFGFVVLRQLLNPGEAARMKREAERVMAEDRKSRSLDPTKWQPLQPFFERSQCLTQFLDDDRICGIGEDLAGPDFVLQVTEGNLHVGDTPWHGGTGEETQLLLTIKITFYLDHLTRDTGCLRVIPGSQKLHCPDNFNILRSRNDDPSFRPFGVHPAQVPSVAIESEPGDVVVFTEDLLHAAFGGKPGRHQHAINFAVNPKTDEQLAQIRELYSRFRFGLRPVESLINSDQPRLRRMVSKLVELGFESSKV